MKLSERKKLALGGVAIALADDVHLIVGDPDRVLKAIVAVAYDFMKKSENEYKEFEDMDADVMNACLLIYKELDKQMDLKL